MRGIPCYLFMSLKECFLGKNTASLETLLAFAPVFEWLNKEGIINQTVERKDFERIFHSIPKENHPSSNPLFL